MEQANQSQPTGHVVVADDEPLIRMDVADAFERMGFIVLGAEHAAAALIHLRGRAHQVVALITDIQMPGDMDGVALVHEVRRCWPWIHLIVASGRLRPTEDDLPNGCRFLSKPYESDHAVRHVCEMMATAA